MNIFRKKQYVTIEDYNTLMDRIIETRQYIIKLYDHIGEQQAMINRLQKQQNGIIRIISNSSEED